MNSNTRVPEEVQEAGRVANRTARNAASSRWMSIFARLGYAAKGVVYLIIGWLAVQLAIGAGGKATDQRGAIQTIYEQPFGKFLLVIVVLGLLGFAIWCFLQAWFDTEGRGRDMKGIVGRLGYAVTGVSYTILAFGAFQLVAGTGTSSATKSTTASTQDVTAQPTSSERPGWCITDTHTAAVWSSVTVYRRAWPGGLWGLFFRRSSLSPCWRELTRAIYTH